MTDNDMESIAHLDRHYTRSINLERDADSCDILSAYIPTSCAANTGQNCRNIQPKIHPKAWSLVVPYGSGKSSFAAFLAHLLEDQELETSLIVEKTL